MIPLVRSFRSPLRSFSSGVAAPKPKRSKLLRFSLFASSSLILGYAIDNYYLDSAFTRSFRTLYYAGLILFDNKFADLPDHAKNADRLFQMISKNKGLYIKMGQIISMQSSMFPQEFQDVMKQFLDNAPSDEWSRIDLILRSEMGNNYEELISIDRTPIASASIAQVHKGRWLSTGQEVAIKVQHDSIQKQMSLDLLSYRLMMKLYELSFDMPLQFISKYVSSKLAEECDFNIEYENTRQMNELISNSGMKNDIYIPEMIYHSKRVLISEFINADSFDKLRNHDIKKVMDKLITCFSKQIFEWGLVHCDPHPGNFLILPNNKLVILDHGLYLHLPEDFKYDYANLWKNLFELNFEEIKKIATKWGVGSPELFSGMMLAKPQILYEQINKHPTDKEMNEFLRKQMLNFFKNTDKFPLELVFLSRAIRMLQLLNLQFGSPSNRVGIMSSILIKNSRRTTSYRLTAGGDSIRFNWKSLYNLIILKFVIFVNDFLFQTFRFKQFIKNLFGLEDQGVELALEDQVNQTAKRFGFNMDRK